MMACVKSFTAISPIVTRTILKPRLKYIISRRSPLYNQLDFLAGVVRRCRTNNTQISILVNTSYYNVYVLENYSSTNHLHKNR